MIRGWKRGICVKDKTQTVGWIILFLIASGFFGFISAWLLKIEDSIAFLTVSGTLAFICFIILLVIYRKMLKRANRQALWAMLNRGCYHEVNHRISEKNKQMRHLWELKMLASFHSGDMATYDRLYKNYMNEINECRTLPAYMLCVLHELVDAMSHDKPPAVFLRNDTIKHSYVKQRDYQLYHYIQQGIQEYYGNQKHLMKIYFERFMMQTNVLSKPLGFHLHYLMTVFMVANDHPQWEEYFHKTQQYIFDQRSQSYMDQLKSKIYGLQKGTGNQELMNRDQSRKRNNPLFENESTQSLNRSFNYQQPNQREETNFTSRRHSADIQKEFDEMNSSLDNSNAFPLYEDDESNFLNQKNSNAGNNTSSIPISSDVGDDLDPTWFARKTMENTQPDTTASRAFDRRNPSMSEPSKTNSFPKQRAMNQGAMSQEPMNRSAYQDDTQGFTNQRMAMNSSMDNPSFTNQRRDMNRNVNDQTMFGQNNMAMNQQAPLNASQTGEYPNQNAYMQNQGQNVPQFRSNNNMQANNSFQPFDDDDMDDEPRLQAQNFASTKSKKKKASRKERKRMKAEAKQEDSFLAKDRAIRTDKESSYHNHEDVDSGDSQPYMNYLRQNITIFFVTLLDATLVSITTASTVYTSFFNRFSSINSDIVPEIIMMAAIITLIAAYATASLHTGYTILKKSTRNWNRTAKIILFPVLFVLALIIGIICEIPYLIFANIKKRNE